MKRFLMTGIIGCILFAGTSFAHQEKIVLCVFYTDSHEQLAQEYFFKTLQDDFEVVHYTAPQAECPTGEFYKKGWTEVMLRKAQAILQTIQDYPGRVMLYADMDIQWIRPATEDLFSLLEGYDLRVQRDHPKRPMACAGFVLQRCNDKVEAVWQMVCDLMVNKKVRDDQAALNRVLNGKMVSGLKWDYLPNRYLSGGTITGRMWRPGMSMSIPEDIVIHHANWTKGFGNKIKQLEYVASVVRERISG